MQWFHDPYRRWLGTALLFFGWCGLVPIVLIAGYYAVTTNTDFDPALTKLRSGPEPQKRLAWVIRVGSSSVHWEGGAFVSTWVGLNVDDAESQRRHDQVFEGAGLTETRRATYLAEFQGSPLPVVITAFRDVSSDGHFTYDAELNGRRPIASYFLFLSGGSVFAVIFFELVEIAQKRRRKIASSPVIRF
jgi:hypothetical protein